MSKQTVYSQPILSYSHGLPSAKEGCLRKNVLGERDQIGGKEKKESSKQELVRQYTSFKERKALFFQL